MADRDRNPDTSINVRDGDAANGERPADRLGRTATESAGGNVVDPEAEECEGFDIVFEREESETTTH